MIEDFLAYSGVIGLGLVGAFVSQSRFTSKEGRLLLASYVMHVLFSFANAYVILYVYGRGDPLEFVANGTSVRNIMLLDPIQMGPEVFKMLIGQEFELPVHLFGGKRSTYSMYALSAVAQLFVGSTFGVVHMTFAVLSYFAKVELYAFFRSFVSPQHRQGALIASTLVPTVVFWSAGLIKETIVIIGMAITARGYLSLTRGLRIGVVLLPIGLYAIALIKAFILLTLAAGVAAWIAWDRSVRRGRLTLQPHYLLLALVVGALGMFGVGEVFPQFSIERLGAEIATMQQHGGKGGSGIHVGDASNTSLLGQLQYVPIALFIGLYRPGIWEAGNPQMLLNGMETLAFLVLTLRFAQRIGYQGMIDRLVRYPPLAFCIVFALTMAVGTGLTTFNLGSLSRYRMPLLPFFVMFLVVMNQPLPRAAAAPRPAPRPRVPSRPRRRRRIRRPRDRRPAPSSPTS